MSIIMNFSPNKSDEVTHLLCNFHSPKPRYWKKSIIRMYQVISRIKGKVKKKIGIFFKISTNYAMNMWLVAFARKLYEIYQYRCNNFLAFKLIHLHRNNMVFNKNHLFMASPGGETSDIIQNVALLAA